MEKCFLLYGLTYRNLILSDSTFESVECDLASNYEISSDGLEYAITLKENILLSDGEPLTIEDVVFSIEAVLQSNTANEFYTIAFSKIEGYETFMNNSEEGLAGIEVTGENSISIINLRI